MQYAGLMSSTAPEFVIWADAARVPLVRTVLDLMGAAVQPLGVGSPRPQTAAAMELARDLDCVFEDDLRKLLVEKPSAYLLLASAAGLGAEELRLAQEHDTIVLAVEPISASLDAPLGPGVRRLPDFRQGVGWRSAAEPTDVLGALRAASYWSLGAGEVSLFARLAEAWTLLLSFVPHPGVPSTITAALTGSAASGIESLRGVGGSLSLQTILGDHCAATMLVSDRAGSAERRLTLVGEGGRLRVDDLSYTLYDASGRIVDQCSPQGVADFADLVAQDWRRLIDQGNRLEERGEPQESAVLACCLTTLLAARTRQPESPAAVLRMRGR